MITKTIWSIPPLIQSCQVLNNLDFAGSSLYKVCSVFLLMLKVATFFIWFICHVCFYFASIWVWFKALPWKVFRNYIIIQTNFIYHQLCRISILSMNTYTLYEANTSRAHFKCGLQFCILLLDEKPLFSKIQTEIILLQASESYILAF